MESPKQTQPTPVKRSQQATLNLIGAGKVGQTLAGLWHSHGLVQVQDVCTRSLASAQAACQSIGSGHAVEHIATMRPADLWLLAVPDAQIATVAAQLAAPLTGHLARHAAQHPAQPTVVWHCSGAQASTAMLALGSLASEQPSLQLASAHPILSFADVQRAKAQFAGTLCALEGPPSACATLAGLLEALGACCCTVAAHDKLLYHAAAVFATNFVPVLQQVAEQAWLASGVPPEALPGLRERLLRNAVDNVLALGPVGALTGPAARGDTAHIAAQAASVSQWNADAGAAYEALSRLALSMRPNTTTRQP
ncbi:DUF2520 domain-containing protein [Curvibacter sp. CHRR-16]|uniref:Rossmann-like and DUF2520 domain-containing protein n=1 Tax=Curvibacter sp. CHRR-16 TaxID=2835872 RepID=UPI001BD933C5|nr:Rossmann-like and DUF2520 domain-containing protein [Curvibacter sp. CHRR-16]MBT0570500.1 DUF2520 domain-containing protein [Curvibacter sp. CHRR-16]